MEIKDRIQYIFKNTLKENPPKDWKYYQSLGYDGPTDLPTPAFEPYSLNSDGYEFLSTGMKSILAELLEKVDKEDYNLAFNGYKLIVRECAKLYKKSIEDFLISEQNQGFRELILLSSYEARMGIVDLVKKAANEKTIKKVLDWLLSEIVRKEYVYQNQFIGLCDLFFLLYSTDEFFMKQVKCQMQVLLNNDSYPYKFLLAASYYSDHDLDALDNLISKNLLVFRLMKYVVELHVMDENYDSGLQYALFCLEEHAKDRRYLFSMEDEVRMKRFPDYPGMDLYALDVQWVVDFVMGTLVQNKKYDEAIAFILNTDNKYRVGSINEYEKLAQQLPIDKKNLFRERLAEKAANTTVFASREICRYLVNWFPLVESIQISPRLSDIYRVCKECKEELKPFSSQIQQVFAAKLMEYISKDSGSSRKKLILDILNEMLIMNNDTTRVFQSIQKIQHIYAGRDLLIGFLDEFIVDSGIKESYALFLKTNEMSH